MKRRPLNICVLLMFLFTSFFTGCESNQKVAESESTFSPLRVGISDCGYGGEIKSVEAVDRNTVRFTLCQPDVAFPAKIASPIFAMQDQEVLNTYKGDSLAMSEAPIGTGAYILSKWNKGKDVTLAPSSNYWGVPAISSSLKFQWVPEGGIRYGYTTFLSVAGIDQPPISLVPMIQQNENLRVLSNIPMNLYYIGFSNKVAPFDKVEVRKALALAIDRQQMVLENFPEGSEIAQQIIPSNVQPGRSVALRWYKSDPEQAVELLKSVNFDFSQEITFAVMNSSMQYIDYPSNIAKDIKNQLAEINIKIKIVELTQAEFLQNLQAGREMMYLYAFQVDYDDGAAFLERPFISEGNFLGDPYTEIQEKIKEVLSIPDEDARQEIFDQINQLVLDQVPLIPLGHAAHVTVFRKTVQNATSNSFFENFEAMSNSEEELRFIGINEPLSMIPADEDDLTTFRITRLLFDTLLAPGFGDEQTRPLLAESWSSSTDLTEWTFNLRYDVKFSNGASFDANDVVATFSSVWNEADPNHKGRTGDFTVFRRLFGNTASID